MAQLWFKIWAKEYLADAKVRCLTYEQRGILQTLWSFAWEEGSIPADPETLATMLGIPAKAMRSHMPWVNRFFQPHPDDPSRLVSPRLELDRIEADLKGSKARESASIRWSKRNANASSPDVPPQCDDPCVDHAGQGQGTEKEVPPTPKGGLPPSAPVVPVAVSSGKRPRRSKVETLRAYNEETRRVVNTLGPIWPFEGNTPDGEKTSQTDTAAFCLRVSALLDAGNDPDLLIESAKDYFLLKKKKFSAPQFFFGVTGYGGKGDAPCVGHMKLILTKRQQKAAEAQHELVG